MKTQEMTVPTAGLVPATLTDEQVDLVKRTVCKGSTDDELKLFLYTAKKTGLDPLARQIHAVKRGGTMTIQTGIDGYRLTADRTGAYAPGPITVTMGKDGKVESATAIVRKLVNGTWHDVSATAYFAEYAVPNSPMWAKMPRLMISKCAEALALRRAFPAELSGLYTTDEMAQADVTPQTIAKPQQMQTKATTQEQPPVEEGEVVDRVEDPEQPGGPQHEDAPKPPQSPADARVITEKQGKRLYAIWKNAGKSDADVKAWLKDQYGYTSTREIKDGTEYEAICEWAAKN